jgi:hypothetical protein
MKSRATFLNEVKRTCEVLAEMGLIQDTGHRRNGQVVWVITPLGRAYAERLAEKAAALGRKLINDQPNADVDVPLHRTCLLLGVKRT